MLPNPEGLVPWLGSCPPNNLRIALINRSIMMWSVFPVWIVPRDSDLTSTRRRCLWIAVGVPEQMVQAPQCLVEIDAGITRVHIRRRGVGIQFNVLKAAACLYEQVIERLKLFSLIGMGSDRRPPSDAEAVVGDGGSKRHSIDSSGWSEWLYALQADCGPVAFVTVTRSSRNRDDLTEMLLQRRAGCLGGHHTVDAGRRPAGADACIQVELLLDHKVIAALTNGAGEIHPSIRSMHLGLDGNNRGDGINECVVLHGWCRSTAP